MSRKIKVWLIIAICFIVVGLTFFVVGLANNNWSFRKLGQKNFVTNEYNIIDDFDKISLDVATADVEFKISTDEKCKVVCYENKKEYHQTKVENGELKINIVNEKKWYEYLELNFCTPKITVYMPNLSGINLEIKVSTGKVLIPTGFTFNSIDISGSTSDIKCFAASVNQTKIYVSTGDIVVENTSAESYDLLASTGKIKLTNVNCLGELKLKVSTGHNYLTNINCNSLVSTGSTGDIKLQNTIVSNKITITRNTGDIEFYRCDAGELVLTTSTGDVEGSLLSSKVFIVRTDTGEIDVPSSKTGGKCQITTDTGDVEIRIVNN